MLVCVCVRYCKCVWCEIWSTMSLAFSLSTYTICLKARPCWSACSSSSISSCCRSESAARPAQCSGTADIHILPCTVSMCAGAGWVGWCNLTGLDVLWRIGEAQVDTVRAWTCCSNAIFFTYVHLCLCITLLAVSLKVYVGRDIVNTKQIPVVQPLRIFLTGYACFIG